MKSNAMESIIATHLVAAFLPVVADELATGKRVLRVKDGASEAQRRAAEAVVKAAANNPDAVTESLVEYLDAFMSWGLDESHRDAAEWVAAALCDAAIKAAWKKGRNTHAEIIYGAALR